MVVESTLALDLGLVIIAATAISLLMRFLKQPLVLGYVIGGVLIGPAFLKFVVHPSEIAILSELGIAFLLFVIGLELDFKKIKQVGLVSSGVGLLQVSLCALVGFLVSLSLGFGVLPSIYIALGVSFSSTMVVIKILSDNKELESLHGELVLGIMLVQDIIAIFALSILTSLDSITPTFFLFFALKVALFGVLIVVASLIVLPWLMRQVSSSSELIFLAALSTIFLFAFLANKLQFSIAIGAFLAGLALSASPLHLDIRQRIEPLRDFFLVMFFVTLGMQVTFGDISVLIVPMVALIAVGMLGKGIITFFVLKGFRYGHRTSFLTSVQVAQVGEFSLVLVALGITLGHLDAAVGSLITIVALSSILLSTYLIKLDDNLFNFLPKLLPFFKENGVREESLTLVEKDLHDHIVLFGYHKIAPVILSTLIKKGTPFVIVDHNPEKVRTLVGKNINSICGSLINNEIYDKVSMANASMVVSTINFKDKNRYLLQKLKAMNKDAIAIVTASSVIDAIDLYKAGADYVIVPDTLGGEKVSNYIEHLTPQGIREWGVKHLASLQEQVKEFGVNF